MEYVLGQRIRRRGERVYRPRHTYLSLSEEECRPGCQGLLADPGCQKTECDRQTLSIAHGRSVGRSMVYPRGYQA
ncbi:unnamed protein product [Boreogadus saida]